MGTEPRARGSGNTRFLWLLMLSLLLHLLLTPLTEWIGLLTGLAANEEAEPPPLEELDAIPVELFQDGAIEPPTPVDPLPEADPVALIDRLIPTAPTEAAKPKPMPPPVPTVRPDVSPPPVADAGVAAPPSTAPAPSMSSLPATPKDAGASTPKARRRGSNIGEAVALAGEAGKLTESNARLALTLYTDRIRNHPVGARIEQMLPMLPQWNDFFGEGGLNPIRDFDRFFMAGPSFYHTEQVVVALQYNATPARIRSAIDRLVQRRGEWLKGTKFPAAMAFADRAERLFAMPAANLVLVAPPQLKSQVLGSKLTGIPAPAGKEAFVAFTKQPYYALSRLGLDVSKTLSDAKLVVTPLADGSVRLEVTAKEVSPEAARATADQVAQAINSLLSLAAGASNLLSQLGFGSKGVTFPKIQPETDGNVIHAQVELQKVQIDFILDRVERQLIRRPAQPTTSAPRPAPVPAERRAKVNPRLATPPPETEPTNSTH